MAAKDIGKDIAGKAALEACGKAVGKDLAGKLQQSLSFPSNTAHSKYTEHKQRLHNVSPHTPVLAFLWGKVLNAASVRSILRCSLPVRV